MQYSWGLSEDESKVETEKESSASKPLMSKFQSAQDRASLETPISEVVDTIESSEGAAADAVSTCVDQMVQIGLIAKREESSLSRVFVSTSTQTEDPPSGFLRIIRVKEGNVETETRAWVNLDGSELEAQFHVEILRNSTMKRNVVEASYQGIARAVVKPVPVRLPKRGASAFIGVGESSPNVTSSVEPRGEMVEFDGEFLPASWSEKPRPHSVHKHLRPKGCFNCYGDHKMHDCKKEPLHLYCFVCALPGVIYPKCPCCHAK